MGWKDGLKKGFEKVKEKSLETKEKSLEMRDKIKESDLMDKIVNTKNKIEGLSQFQQNEEIEEQVRNVVSTLLMKNEEIKFIIVQKKIMEKMSQSAVILTDKRFIKYEKSILGKALFNDDQWRNLKDVHIADTLRGATLTFEPIKGKPISIGKLPKDEARRAYSFAQEKELEMEEVRRKRELEDKMAGAGGVTIQAPMAMPQQQQNPPPSENQKEDSMVKLKKLKEMLDMELITQEDFDAKKKGILSDM